MLAGVSGAALKEKRSGKFFFPLAGIALILSGFLVYNVKLKYDAGRYKTELSSISGIPIEEATFKKMNSAGFPEWEEPVASMIRNSPLLYSELGSVANVQEGKKMLREFEKKYSDYLKALDKFLQMKPSFVLRTYICFARLNCSALPDYSVLWLLLTSHSSLLLRIVLRL